METKTISAKAKESNHGENEREEKIISIEKSKARKYGSEAKRKIIERGIRKRKRRKISLKKKKLAGLRRK
jgi:hypothetical protein